MLGGALGCAAHTLDGIWLAGGMAGWGLAGAGWQAGWPQGFLELREPLSGDGKIMIWGGQNHNIYQET